jgi:hypothetical protein
MGLFSKGKASITIPKTNFYPGEVIQGAVNLMVDKPTLADEFHISLIGEKQVTVRRRTSKGDYVNETETTRIYDFKQTLDGAREYAGPTQYGFSIQIPQDILAGLQPQTTQAGGFFGFVQTAANAMSSAPRYSWYLQATLNIPKSLDINKKADITIG